MPLTDFENRSFKTDASISSAIGVLEPTPLCFAKWSSISSQITTLAGASGRSSGSSHGYVVGHICPEAQEGGPIGLVQNSDIITIDISKMRMDVQLTEEELNERRNCYRGEGPKCGTGMPGNVTDKCIMGVIWQGKTLSENAKLLPCLSEGQVILESYILSYTSSLLKNSSKGKVVVTRGEGPKGGPGMPEMLTPTSAIMGGWSWQGNQSLLLDDLLPKVLGVTLSLGILQLVAIPDTVGLM
ncbi:dihydroxy-acid dehydratase, chloroplastic [Tanacetum coccineum]|uniref:Dihydroxy-acid dehydratase, chloroplastic n=1 Tax=Tanacetum coccineum TaxID=301880 RepID=A0ABQ5IER3_9ASTR